MYVNCRRAEVNREAGRLEVHAFGILGAEGGPPHHFDVGDNSTCAACGKALAVGELGAVIGELVYHGACCSCQCSLHNDMRRIAACFPDDVRRAKACQADGVDTKSAVEEIVSPSPLARKDNKRTTTSRQLSLF